MTVYQYRATVRKVVDGDTLHLNIDLGIDISVNITVRLAGINCPEMSTAEGIEAHDFVAEWVKSNPRILIATYKDRKEKFGRYVAEVFDINRADSLNDLLVKEGHAKRVVYK